MKLHFVFAWIVYIVFPLCVTGNQLPARSASAEGRFRLLPRHIRETLTSSIPLSRHPKTQTPARRTTAAVLAPPANDNIINRQILFGSTGAVTIDNTEATVEPGEPHHIPALPAKPESQAATFFYGFETASPQPPPVLLR